MVNSITLRSGRVLVTREGGYIMVEASYNLRQAPPREGAGTYLCIGSIATQISEKTGLMCQYSEGDWNSPIYTFKEGEKY